MQNEETKAGSSTAKPVFNSSFFIRHSAFVLIALIALAVRLPRLGERPMHTDESVNAYITGELLAGEAFHYDPQDRHGPALFAVAEPLVKLQGAKNFSGLTETQLRLTPVIAGSVTVLLFGAGVDMFGFTTCLVAALLFTFAPLPVYYSRYFIHETLFITATLGLVLSGWRALKNSSVFSGALAGFCAALMLACKETAVLHFFAIAVTLLAFRFVTPGGPSLKIISAAFAVFILTLVLLFTWFGQNWTGLADLFRAIPHLAARAGGEGHEKPFGWYFHLLDPLLVLFLVAAAGVYAAICDAVGGARKPALLLVIYGLVIFLVYSAIPYKTPWLALNLWLPFTLVCGVGIAAFWELAGPSGARWGVGIAGAVLLAILAAQTRTLVFDQPADEKNPFAYAHTGEDLLRLPGRLEALARQNNMPDPRIAVIAADAWPLPWYLRKFSRVGFWQPGQEIGAADFYITTTDVSGRLAEQLKDFRPENFGVRPNVLIILWTPAETNAPVPAPGTP